MAKPVGLIDQGEIKGLSGTTDGDYLRWNGTTSAWESQAGSGGGGVSSVGATAPLASSGGATPTISLSAGTDGQILVSNGTAYSSQTVSGDATITNAGAVTVTGLQGYDVSNAAPANNQLLVWNSTSNAWVPGSSAQGGSGGGGILLYLNNQTNGDTPTTGLTNAKQVGPIATDTTNTITSATLSQVNYDLVATFVTDVDYPGITDIPAGLWDFNFWAQSTGTTSNQTIVQIQVYKYNGTTATLLATSDDIYIYDPTVTAQYIGNVTFANETILATDRIVIELRAKATQNNRTITFSFGGSTPAHFHTTIPSVSGTGLVKVVNGVFQTPASQLVNVDVADTADIAVSKLANGSSGQILVAGASDLAYQTMSGDATMASTGALTLANSGVSANTYGSASSVPVTTVDAKGRVTGVVDTSIAIAASQVTSGTLGVARGGTGASTLTDRAVLVGNGTDAVTSVGPLTDGQLIIGSTGGDPVAASLTGTANQITVTNGVGQITLSTPQDIATTSSPTFAGASIATTGSGTTTIGNTTSGGSVAVRTSITNTLTLTPGMMTATLGTQTTAGTAGGAISMTAGVGATTGAGGAFNVTGGTGGTTGVGGAVAILGGYGGGTSGSGGAVTVYGGSAVAAGAAGGDVTVQAGAGNGAASGTLKLFGGTGSVASDAGTGSISILAGKNATIANRSGDVTIQGGYDAAAAANVLPGRVNIFGGDTSFASNGKTAGSLVLRGGNNTGTGSNSNGGAVTITGGSGTNGGAVTITSGASSGSSVGPTVTIQGGSGTSQNGTVLVSGGTGIIRASSTSTSKGILLASTDTSGSGYIGVGIDGFLCFSQGSETITTGATTLTPLRTYHAVTADVAGITTVRTISPGFTTITAGTVVIIFNAGTNSFTLTNTGGNIRMTTATAALPARGHIAFIYDGTNFREIFRNVATAITGTAAA
jgi:hypothetical protein